MAKPELSFLNPLRPSEEEEARVRAIGARDEDHAPVPQGSFTEVPGFIPADSRRNSPPSDFNPVLLTQLRDDLTRSRLREAFWISLVGHLVAAILLVLSPKWMPVFYTPQLRTAEQMIHDKEYTYLEMPSDRQRPSTKAPDTKFMSDRNRIAKTKVPSPDRKVLDSLRRPGPPGETAPPASQPGPGPDATSTARGQQQQQADNSSRFTAPPEPKPDLRALAGALSPGTSIAQAARNSPRTGFTTGGGGGGFGRSLNNGGKVGDGIDVLSDTMGVNFGPYLSRVLAVVRLNWYSLIPEEARPPLLKKGRVAIEFVILPDGKVGGMRLAGQSGDIALDRAAWGGISASNPFSPLPSEFHGPYLALRFHFYYNPDPRDYLD